MNDRIIHLEPLTAEAFAPFGDILEASGSPDMIINAGYCGRFHDLARFDFSGEDGRAGLSIFRSKARTLPYELDLMERHPLGSQAFVPMSREPFMVIVAPDDNGTPGIPKAFMTQPSQGVNFLRNTWHGVLTPFIDDADFAVIDRIGDGENLEEYVLPRSYIIEA